MPSGSSRSRGHAGVAAPPEDEQQRLDALLAPQRHEPEGPHADRRQHTARHVGRRRELGEPRDDEGFLDPIEVLGQPRELGQRQLVGDLGPVRDPGVAPLGGRRQCQPVGRHLGEQPGVGAEVPGDEADRLGEPPLLGRRVEQQPRDLLDEGLRLGSRARGGAGPEAPEPGPSGLAGDDRGRRCRRPTRLPLSPAGRPCHGSPIAVAVAAGAWRRRVADSCRSHSAYRGFRPPWHIVRKE